MGKWLLVVGVIFSLMTSFITPVIAQQQTNSDQTPEDPGVRPELQNDDDDGPVPVPEPWLPWLLTPAALHLLIRRKPAA